MFLQLDSRFRIDKLHTLLLTKFLVIIGLALFTAACDGPAGPEGPEGPQGEQGPQGPQGPAGEDGNANVMYSDWRSIGDFPAIRDTMIDGSNLKVTHWQTVVDPHPTITEEIANNGIILVYMRFSNSIYLLPYTSDAGGTANTLDFLVRPTKLFITRFTHDDSGSAGIGNVDFRYVLIPGNIAPGGLQAGLRTELDTGDYEAVRAFYGIPDEGAGEVPAGGAW